MDVNSPNEWEVGEHLTSTNILVEKQLRCDSNPISSRVTTRIRAQSYLQSFFSFDLRKLSPVSSNADAIRKIVIDLDQYLATIPLKTQDQFADPFEATVFHHTKRWALISELLSWRLSFDISNHIENNQLSSYEKKAFPLPLVSRRSRIVRELSRKKFVYTADDVRKLIRKYNQ